MPLPARLFIDLPKRCSVIDTCRRQNVTRANQIRGPEAAFRTVAEHGQIKEF
jgi:hypothetical protein